MQQALFEIEGNPRKKVIRELRSYIAVFPGHIHIEVDGGAEEIDIRDVFNIFIQEPVFFDIKSRTTVIDYYFEGEEMRYELDDEIYPGLSYRIEEMLRNDWAQFPQKKKYTDTVRWFNSVCAVIHIMDGLDPDIFGGMFDTMEASVAQKDVLYNEWDITTRASFRDKLDKMTEDRSVWANVSVIRLAGIGFVAGYLNRHSAYGYCLKAGQNLQRMCRGWEDMAEEYLAEHCRREKLDITDENSKAFDMREIFQNLMKTEGGPYSIDFFYPLSEEWLESGGAGKIL